MTDEEYERCERVLASVHKMHNWRHVATKAGIVRHDWMVEVRMRGELATFDGDEMTRLVLAAHREYVRVSVSGLCRGHLQLYLHPRQPTGSGFERHPGLERLAPKLTINDDLV